MASTVFRGVDSRRSLRFSRREALSWVTPSVLAIFTSVSLRACLDLSALGRTQFLHFILQRDCHGRYRLRYHYIVSNAAKLVAKMRRNPRDWRIEDLKVVARSMAIDYDQHGTSHVIFRHANAGRLSVPAHRPIKPVYVRLFTDFVDKAGENHED